MSPTLYQLSHHGAAEPMKRTLFKRGGAAARRVGICGGGPSPARRFFLAQTPSTMFITGASVGIGRATAELFAERGWRLVLNARNAKRLAATAKDLRQRHGVDVQQLVFDVSDRRAVEKAAVKHAKLLASVDVLVNNAGLALGLDPIPEGRLEDWEATVDVNVKGLLYVTRAVLPHMVKRGRGHVINLGSTAGHWVYRGGAVYCASKHAVRALTEGLRLDLHGTGVRVSSIDPGIVGGTEFSLVRFKGDAARAKKVYEGFEPLTPRDVAECIAWAVERPAHVNIQEIILTPTAQASVRDVQRRTA